MNGLRIGRFTQLSRNELEYCIAMYHATGKSRSIEAWIFFTEV